MTTLTLPETWAWTESDLLIDTVEEKRIKIMTDAQRDSLGVRTARDRAIMAYEREEE